MVQRVFIVYREGRNCAPKAIDAMLPEANDIISRFDWYGARADTVEAAIKEFEEFEKSEQAMIRCGAANRVRGRARVV